MTDIASRLRHLAKLLSAEGERPITAPMLDAASEIERLNAKLDVKEELERMCEQYAFEIRRLRESLKLVQACDTLEDAKRCATVALCANEWEDLA